VPPDNQLRGPLDGNKAIGISAQGIAAGVALFLAVAESPNFIDFQIAHGEPSQGAIKQALAAFPDEHKHVQDGIAVNACDSLNRADADAFDKQADNLLNLFFALVGSVQLLRAFTVCLQALTATKALVSLTVFSKLLAFCAAVVTGHFLPCLLQSAERK
jgi:hypothetical protein